jgi:alpha-amylase
MLGALERHPAIRIGLHYSGPLLEWLASERPAFLDRLASLAASGQVELLGGGYHEPILAAIPERDRHDQLRRMAERVALLTGRPPAGAWLAERVWEPDVPTSLVDAGYRWTILDDTHFRAAGIDETALFGAYTTDDQGRRLTLFGTDRGLRYGVPFGSVPRTIAYLQGLATADGGRLAVMGDDGEKFGSWPRTHDHCWGRGRWVERFLRALEATSRSEAPVVTVTPTAWLSEHEPIGRVYVPTASYDEMGEWALPVDESALFATTIHRAREAGDPAARWLRGGFWRNYQARYREINDLHKQMLRVSDKVAAMPEGPARETALDHLGRGQSNDCYWHGIFGGIYLAHMRVATLGHLIAAEDIADSSAGEAADPAGRPNDGIVALDIDLDGADELLATTPGQVVVIDPAEGGAIGAWDIRASRHPLASVMRRRPEAYHARLIEATGRRRRAAGERTSSIHDAAAARDPGLVERLHYDSYERRSGLVHLLAPGTGRDAFLAGAATWLCDAHTGRWASGRPGRDRVTLTRDVALPVGRRIAGVRLRKRFVVGTGRSTPALEVSLGVEHLDGPSVSFDLAVEWAINLLGGGNPAAWYEIGGTVTGHDAAGERASTGRVSAGNRTIGIEIATTFSPATTVWWGPIETISSSESGFEANYQGSALVGVWPMTLAPGDARVVTVTHRVRCSDGGASATSPGA